MENMAITDKEKQKDRIAKASYSGELDLNGYKISCAVLEDGTRVLVSRSLAKALGIKGGGAYWQTKREKSGEVILPEYLSAKYLSLFISEKLRSNLTKPIIYQLKNGTIREGIPANLLSDILDVYINAGKEGAFTENQRVADIAYKMLLAFSKVGIIALVDEATGYQHEREQEELQKILKAYISEELLPWQKRFPDVFYKELFRLNGWDYTVNGIKKRPSIIGKWTNILVYEQLPVGVLDALKKRTPKSTHGNRTARYHQSLTLDIGEPNLNNAIMQAVTIFQISSNMSEMWANFNKLKERQNGQLELPFKFDENGHTDDIL